MPDAILDELQGQIIGGITQQQADAHKVVLDWSAYFREFCVVHGTPVEHGGRLLFSDGWTHSATDYEGPEWPPPHNPKELRALQRAYWKEMVPKLEGEHRVLVQELRELVDVKGRRSAPLQMYHRAFNEDGQPMGWRVGPLDLSPLRARIGHVGDMLDEARSKLKELEVG